ncbi:MAG: hypothetical protein D6737_08750 [Chloroflexi bacterium]|nr:MAG: hypothetical protein D6737_08750 [Chloroflexota bacterium]
MSLFDSETSAKIRLTLAIAWTIVSVYVLLLPGDTPVIEGLAALLKNLGFTIGHFVGFGILAGLWQWTLLAYLSPRWALIGAISIALVVGLSTEVAQISVEGRGADVVDVIADMSGAIATVMWLYHARGRFDGQSATES